MGAKASNGRDLLSCEAATAGMPVPGMLHRVSFTFDTASEARDCYAHLEDALPDLVVERRVGQKSAGNVDGEFRGETGVNRPADTEPC